MLKIYKKFKESTEALEFFTSREWKFSTNNGAYLYNTLSTADKQLFDFSTDYIEWPKYMDNYIAGKTKSIFLVLYSQILQFTLPLIPQ